MQSVAPILKNPRVDAPWHQEFINRIGPYDLSKSGLLSREPHIPLAHRFQKLYRYSSYKLDYLKKACIGGLHLSNPQRLNDPYDLYANISVMRILEWLAPLHGAKSNKELIQLIQRNIPDGCGHILRKFYTNVKNSCEHYGNGFTAGNDYEHLESIFKGSFKAEMSYASFSEVNNNSPMWAYYGDSHFGYCLEYEPKDCAWHPNQFGTGTAYYALMPVIYTEIPFDGNEYLQKTIMAHTDIVGVEQIAFILMAILCLQKLTVWSHEKEWRLIASADDTGESIPHHASPLKLSAIHAGLCMPEEHVLEIRKYLSSTDIKFYRMGIHKDSLQICSSKNIPESTLLFGPKELGGASLFCNADGAPQIF